MSIRNIDIFQRKLTEFYADSGRHDMPWRQPEPNGSFDPYKILVSELMLQQTQVSRVTPKFGQFVERFPTVESLASASIGEVLQLWSGLGYNRRAKFLWQAARLVVTDFGGVFPRTMAELQRLSGVGPNTAGAISAYAFNQPVVYVETNIRTVVIHHFFQTEAAIPDAAIRKVLAQILATDQSQIDLGPRDFYWAMMDYGAYLKKSVGNLNQASQSYRTQSTFQGSRRQLRGHIIRLLTERPYRATQLVAQLKDDRVEDVLADLFSEAMAVKNGEIISLG